MLPRRLRRSKQVAPLAPVAPVAPPITEAPADLREKLQTVQGIAQIHQLIRTGLYAGAQGKAVDAALTALEAMHAQGRAELEAHPAYRTYFPKPETAGATS